MLLRTFLFFVVVSSIVCSLTYYLLKKRLGLSRTGNQILFATLATTMFLLVAGPMTYRLANLAPSNPLNFSIQWAQYFLMGWAGTILITFGTLEIIQLLISLDTKPFDPSKRIFLTEGVAKGLLATATLSVVGGFAEAQMGPKVEPVTIKLKSLPESFDGMTLAQISDIHIGPLLNKAFLENVVDQVMALNADFIFITGDLVDGSVKQIQELVEPLRKLKAKDGIYFCTGNHEYYSGAEEWIQYLEAMGIHVFKNSNLVFTRGNSKILIGGVFDWHGGNFFPTHETNPKKAAETMEPVSCKILLAHNPKSIDGAAEAGFNLQLSGHTHAGQFYPFVFVVKIVLKHVEGLYQINESTQLYVNRGTGYWGPPNRLGKRSEITHFTLRCDHLIASRT